MSVLYVGSYSWSLNEAALSSSSSTCESTSASEMSVIVRRSGCSNSRAVSTSGDGPEDRSEGANSYGGCTSAVYVGAYAWSLSEAASSNSSSTCGATLASGVSVHVSDSACSNCKASSTSRGQSYGASSYGGSISASFIGALSYSFAKGEVSAFSRSIAENTRVDHLSVTITNVAIVESEALSGEYSCALYMNHEN